MKKFTSVFLAMVLTATVPAGFQTVYAEDTSAEDTQETKTDADNEADADQLLKDLTGSYQELWPVILADDYTQTWIDDCKEIVGEDDAEAAYEKLKSMVTGEVYGEEAVEAYKDDGGAYFCGFTQDMATVEFDGDTKNIKGYDKDEKELFSHTYHYVGMEETRGLYEFESDDADALAKYDAGDYAYWLASGISTEYDEKMVDDCIQLFCEENLSEQ